MMILAALGGLSFLLVSVVGGVRLLLLARRTRGLPEFILGSGLFLLGGVATPLGVVGRLPGLSTELGSAVLLAQSLLMALGMGGFGLFTYRVFRPHDAWARVLAVGLPAVMVLGTGAAVLDERSYLATMVEEAPIHLISQIASLVALGWAGWESLRYAAALRRRVRIGLADPVVFDRVRLWGIAMTLATLMSGVTLTGQLLGIFLMGTVGGAVFVGFVGLVAASAIYLAFLPPAVYTQWVQARAAEGA